MARFRFKKSLNKESKTLLKTEDKIVSGVLFYSSRYGHEEQKITFDEPQTVQCALDAVESFLSKSITEEYFNENSKGYHTFEQMAGKPRGALLGGAIFLERLYVEDGLLSFGCGS
jgi:hypothetical protein